MYTKMNVYVELKNVHLKRQLFLKAPVPVAKALYCSIESCTSKGGFSIY